MPPTLKILVPVDFSRYSLEILEFALSLRRWAEAVFTLLHVDPAEDLPAAGGWGAEVEATQERRRLELLESLEGLASSLRERHPDLEVSCRVAHGVVFKEICRLAEEESYSLIVIGTHGRTGLPHLLIGSTAERVVQHACCPVLSLKPRIV